MLIFVLFQFYVQGPDCSSSTDTHTYTHTHEAQKTQVYNMSDTSDTPRWYGKDSQFGYSPYVNLQYGFEVVSSKTINDYIPPGNLFPRQWALRVLNSSTSALMQMVLGGRGIHLGDAGAFLKRDDIGFFDPVSTYGKAKLERTKLLKVNRRSYIDILKDASVQEDFIEATSKYITQIL